MDYNPVETDFLTRLTQVVEANISNEQFGVSELAGELNMSRSNLLRKVKAQTRLSVSQWIRQVRLKRGMELLRTSAMNVSEVSHQVGFGSTSYFIKCFREFYGYSPGSVGNRNESELEYDRTDPNRKRNLIVAGIVTLMIAVGLFAYYTWPQPAPTIEKSIAVLPFKNDSNDSSNVYLINGLMEATLNNLQKIKDLRVISRASSEKYRYTTKSIPEMAEELNVSYFVEGSGQKIGDEILLNIQLIEAGSDKHLWASQYRRKTQDIFELQQEIAKNIAQEVKAIVTPEEKQRIEKKYTENIEAYEFFLKGREMLIEGERENLLAAIPYFQRAVDIDESFALAYAELTRTYYYLDIFQVDPIYGIEIADYSDKAVLYDPKLAESLIAKAIFYIYKKDYKDALPYLEKALEYNPNSMLALNFIADYYYIYVPNTEKYLEYALMGVKLDASPQDSVLTSNNYFRLSHSLIQTGFLNEALVYAKKSLDFNPSNPIAGYLKIWNEFFINKDIELAKQRLISELEKNPNRIDIMHEVAKACFISEDYKSAFKYYDKFDSLRKAWNLNIYMHEDLNLAITYEKVGLTAKADEFGLSYLNFAEADQTIYKHLYLTAYYSWKDNIPEAIEHLKVFAKEDSFVYWVLLMDQGITDDSIKKHPEFREIMDEIKSRFWKTHEDLKSRFEVKGLLQ